MFRGLHWVGVACILIAAILLLITTISSPVIGDIAILKVMLTNSSDIRHSSVTFGSFGHCVLDVAPKATDQDSCFPKSLGYKPAQIMSQIDGTSFSTAGTHAADDLTDAFILHPIACGLAFIAAICAFGGVIGSLIGTMIAMVAWIITLVVMAIDFAAFGIIKDHVNKDGSGSHAYYSVGMWTCLAAMIMLLLGTIIVFLTCCSERRKKRGGVSKSQRKETRSEKKSRKSRGDMGDTYTNGNTNGTNGHMSGMANGNDGYANDGTYDTNGGYRGAATTHHNTTTSNARKNYY